MNSVILIGRPTAEPSTRYSGTGENAMTVSRFTLAVDRKRKANGDKEADFISCVAFGKTAEFVEKYVTKGKKIGVRGRIQTSSFQNKDGQKAYSTDVICEEVEFCDAAAAGRSQAASAAPQAAPAPAAQPAPLPPAGIDPGAMQGAGASNVGQGFMNIPEGVEDEGLPFG